MKRLIYVVVLLMLLLCGCFAKQAVVQAQEGPIGGDFPVTRAMAAKMVAAAFSSMEEVEAAEQDFSDVEEKAWYAPYIAQAASLQMMVGTEEGFLPEEELSLRQMRSLLEQINPDASKEIVVTEETGDQPVSYSLWTELYQEALKERRAEDSLWSYGISQRELVVLALQEGTVYCAEGSFHADGYDMTPYLYTKLSVLEKEGEILALLEVTQSEPTAENMLYAVENGTLYLYTPEREYTFATEDPDQSRTVGDISFAAGKATASAALQMEETTVKRVSDTEIRLGNLPAMTWAENAQIYDLRGDSIARAEKTDLICGYDTAEFYEKDGTVCAAVLKGYADGQEVRVLLSASDGSFTHTDTVTLCAEGGLLVSKDGAEETEQESLTLTKDGSGVYTVRAKDGGSVEIVESQKSYAGVLEAEYTQEGLCLVNDLDMETYLLGVVPYEMPTSFGLCALQAQAVVARSYAYNAVFGNAYCAYGAHMTDTVASQAYGGMQRAEEAREAVESTAGECVVWENVVCHTYFYSTSGGWGAASGDVWAKDGVFPVESKPYLTSQAHGVTQQMPQTEEEWLAYWKAPMTEGYDQDSPWSRWKVYFRWDALSEITTSNLEQIWKEKPYTVMMEQKDGTFAMQQPSGLGQLQDISVSDRAAGGVVREVELHFAQGTVRVQTENAIRQLLSPCRKTLGNPVPLVLADGSKLEDQSMLPSDFFSLQIQKEESGAATGLSVYGGGYGHGVGMSQYGAKAMADQGMDYREILSHYFYGTETAKVYETEE